MPKKKENEELQKALIENFISLQKVLTNLSVKFDNLSDNISKLLNLFEISAKSFVDKQTFQGTEKLDKGKDKEFLDKINTLLEQNKTIARGLTLMEEKVRERVYGKDDIPRSSPPITPTQFQASQTTTDFKKLPKI